MSGSAPALVAEAIGTFLFFFIAAGAALVATGDPAATLLIVAPPSARMSLSWVSPGVWPGAGVEPWLLWMTSLSPVAVSCPSPIEQPVMVAVKQKLAPVPITANLVSSRS